MASVARHLGFTVERADGAVAFSLALTAPAAA